MPGFHRGIPFIVVAALRDQDRCSDPFFQRDLLQRCETGFLGLR